MNTPQCDANGAPLSGGRIYSYVAGSVNTPAALYTDNTGATPQANPVILNTRGIPASPLWIGGGSSVKLVLTDANAVVLQTIDYVRGVNDPTAAATGDQWVLYTASPTYLSATSFSLAGDQTLTFQTGRRMKSTNTGGSIYSTISTAVFSAGITTVVVINDAGTLDSGLSAVFYALLSSLSPSVPNTNISTRLIASSSNFTTPPNISVVTVFKVTLVAAGGGGGGASGATVAQGGGAGCAVTFVIGGLGPNASYPVTIGAAGAGGGPGIDGTNGGATSIVINGTTYAANGGTKGSGTSAATAAITAGQGTPSASITALPFYDVAYQDSPAPATTNGTIFSGSSGASTRYGTGGVGGRTGSGAGATASGCGAGGGGGVGNTGGGNGAPGLFLVEWIG